MATVSALVDRARLEIGDRGTLFNSVAVADGASVRFELPVRPVAADVQVQTQEANSAVRVFAQPGIDYTVDTENGVINFVNPPNDGTTVVSTGVGYRYFGDADWTTFVNTALSQHLHGRLGVTTDNLDPVEDYPVALLASTQALFALMNDSAFDIDIVTPEGISIPRHQRFDQLMQMLMARQDQYNRLAAALNVGLNRIEMFTLRRVSRATGRLVPIYVEQEVEDTRPAVRAFVPIDQNLAVRAPDTVPDETITLILGEAFSRTFTLDYDLTGKVVKATMRKYQDSAAYRWFDVVVNDAATGNVTISIDTPLNFMLGGGPYWWDISVLVDTAHVHMLREGPLLIEQRPRTF